MVRLSCHASNLDHPSATCRPSGLQPPQKARRDQCGRHTVIWRRLIVTALDELAECDIGERDLLLGVDVVVSDVTGRVAGNDHAPRVSRANAFANLVAILWAN